MAYKTFANGFPLPASDLNNFLMNQSVIVFADAAARTTAIPSPVQGMLTYLVDTSAYESWNGSAFVSISNPGDITAVTAGTGLTGGGTTGDVTLNVDTAQFITSDTVTTSQDLIVADGASSVTRLGVGANDQVLSVVAGAVAWADAGGGGGGDPELTLLASGSIPTGATTATFTGLSGSDVYYFYFLGVQISGDANLYAYLNGTTSAKAVSLTSANNRTSDATAKSSSTYPEIGRFGASPFIGDFAMTVRGASHTGSSLFTGVGGSKYSGSQNEQMAFQSFQSKGGSVLSSFSLWNESARTFTAGTYEIYGG